MKKVSKIVITIIKILKELIPLILSEKTWKLSKKMRQKINCRKDYKQMLKIKYKKECKK